MIDFKSRKSNVRSGKSLSERVDKVGESVKHALNNKCLKDCVLFFYQNVRAVEWYRGNLDDRP